MNVFSYVVDHDTGREPNPYGRTCTLCQCKFDKLRRRRNIVELAKKGDWVIGTGGNSSKSSGRGTLIYAMRVDETPTRGEYYANEKYSRKKLDPPHGDFQRNEQFVLVSRHFYYFGSSALRIPIRFKGIEKNSRGFHYVSEEEFQPFHEWLKSQKRGQRGEPCAPDSVGERGGAKCKSPC